MNSLRNGIANNIAKCVVWVLIGIWKLSHSQTGGGDIQNVRLPRAQTNEDIEKFFAILASLQAYAEIEFLGDGLTGIGPGMKDKLIIDLFRIGALFELSKKEITTLVLRNVLVPT